MGCLRNLIRAVIITLAVVGFMSLGGKELVNGWFSQWFNPSQETIVERAKKVGDFSKINEEFELEKAAGMLGYNAVVAEHKASGQKLVVVDSSKKEILTQADIKSDDIENKLKSALQKVKYQAISIDEIKVTLANCCKPIKGDEIVGYISTGNGVIVHHKDCKNLRDMPNRLINVSWNENTQRKFNARISIVSENKENLLLEILTKASPNNISINGVNTNKKDNEIIYDLKLEVPNLEKLKKFMLDLKHIQSIKEVKRIFG